MSGLRLNDSGKGITELAQDVTTNTTVWKSFQMDPNAYAKKHGYAVSLDATAVSKIKSTSYADAKAALVSMDLHTSAGLW